MRRKQTDLREVDDPHFPIYQGKDGHPALGWIGPPSAYPKTA